jgi:hypothetical protein
MLHKLGYEYTCPECGRPCADDDFTEGAEECIGCEGDPEARGVNYRRVRLTENVTANVYGNEESQLRITHHERSHGKPS